MVCRSAGRFLVRHVQFDTGVGRLAHRDAGLGKALGPAPRNAHEKVNFDGPIGAAATSRSFTRGFRVRDVKVAQLGSAMGAPKKALPAALAANRWGPGQSGNPSGHSGEYGQAVRLARQAAPYAIHRLIALMDSLDERVAAVACNSILDRAFGKPGLVKEEKDNPDVRIANMTHEQRLALMHELLAPMRAYLHEPDDPQADAGETADNVDSAPLLRNRWFADSPLQRKRPSHNRRVGDTT